MYFLAKFVEIFIHPLTYLALLPFISLILLLKKKRTLAIALCSVACFVILLIISPLSQYFVRWWYSSHSFPELPNNSKVALVLSSNGIHHNEIDNRYFLASGIVRYLEGLRLLEQEKIDKLIIFQGNNRSKGTKWLKEGDSFIRLVQQLNLDTSRIKVLSEVDNTVDEARVFSKYYKKELVGKPFILITHGFHMKRSLSIFKSFDLNPIPYSVSPYLSTDSKVHWSLKNFEHLGRVIHELVGLAAYKIQK